MDCLYQIACRQICGAFLNDRCGRAQTTVSGTMPGYVSKWAEQASKKHSSMISASCGL